VVKRLPPRYILVHGGVPFTIAFRSGHPSQRPPPGHVQRGKQAENYRHLHRGYDMVMRTVNVTDGIVGDSFSQTTEDESGFVQTQGFAKS